ncbi:hypothetical protein AB0G32_26370 [Streptomyces sp. NPDC023723]|uniref:hypothetical protein n=1 Tax=Streptomyces sp. NPDC023723 TaxID=3154323 RepID=UPI0033EA2D72
MSERANVSGREVAHAAARGNRAAPPAVEVDVLVIGADVMGLYQLHRARREGFSAVLLEAGPGVGGVGRRHPLAGPEDAEDGRHGSPMPTATATAAATAPDALWEWPQAGAGQGDADQDLKHLVDRHGLGGGIRFGVTVDSAVFEELPATWSVRTAGATDYRARFLVAATGALQCPAERAIDMDRRVGDRPVRNQPGRPGGGRRRDADRHQNRHQRSDALPGIPRKTPSRRAAGSGAGTVRAPGAVGAHSMVDDVDSRACDALKRLGVRGRDGLRLAGYWADAPRTYRGLMTAGFPNFFFPGGPYGPQDMPRGSGQQVDFVTGALVRARDRGREVVEVGLAAEEAWTNLMSGGTRLLSGSWGGRPGGPAGPGGLPRYAGIGPEEDFYGLLAATLEDEYAALIFS